MRAHSCHYLQDSLSRMTCPQPPSCLSPLAAAHPRCPSQTRPRKTSFHICLTHSLPKRVCVYLIPTKSHVFSLAGKTFYLLPLAKASNVSPWVTVLAVHTLAYASLPVVIGDCQESLSMKLGDPHCGSVLTRPPGPGLCPRQPPAQDMAISVQPQPLAPKVLVLWVRAVFGFAFTARARPLPILHLSLLPGGIVPKELPNKHAVR